MAKIMPMIKEKVLEIREKLKTCKSQRSLARTLGIPHKTLHDIAIGKTWRKL